MKRRNFVGRIIGAVATFLVGRRIGRAEKAHTRDSKPRQGISIRVHPLAVPRSSRKNNLHG
jgi:hypothetical protein